MGDFIAQTALERRADGRFRATLSEDWKLWGPAGGYLSAIALRAVGESTSFSRPVSYACQFLRVAPFGAVDLTVASLRRGKRTEALRVELRQDDETVLTAQVWVSDANEAMVHDYTRPPEAPPPESFPTEEEIRSAYTPHPYFRNFERRPIDWDGEDRTEPGEPSLHTWYRFRPSARADDPFVDAARPLVLIDTYTWPSTWRAHPSKGPLPWIAPNLDLYVRFHRDTRPHEWLQGVSRADLAEGGLIAAEGAIWSGQGQLLASGHTQLFCTPRPQAFR